MESNGARLKKLRLEKGLSLEEVHKKTKIHLNILKAIEEDTLVGLNPVYIKGFLKIYCKFLGVDTKDYITDYQEPPSSVKEPSDIPEKTNPFLKKNASLKSNYFSGINIKLKNIFIVIFILFLIVGLFNLGKFISSRNKRKVRVSRLQKIQKSPVTVFKKQPQAAPSKAKESLAEIRLGMRAKDNCWVHLKVDGRVVFHTILKKGKFESWEAKDKIEISLGNAGVIELELNGKPIPPLGRRGQVINNILITKEEGLKVMR